MSKTVEQIEQELDAKIPGSAVSERDGGGGRRLSYLEGWYVIDRLNKIFGPLGWSKEIIEVKEVLNKTPKGEFPAYIVRLALTIHTKEAPDSRYGNRVVKEAYGYGADKSSQNAHELAIKEAVTDALKVAAKDLGMSLGLALYDKEQTNVDYDETPVPRPANVPAAPVRASQGPEPVAASSQEESRGPTITKDDPDKLRAVIRSHVKAAIKKGVLTMEEVKAFLQESYGVDSLDTLEVSRLHVVLKHVQEKTR